MAIEETEQFTRTERADAYLIVAKAAHSRTEGDPLWMAYREVAIDLQCSVTALREALDNLLDDAGVANSRMDSSYCIDLGNGREVLAKTAPPQ